MFTLLQNWVLVLSDFFSLPHLFELMVWNMQSWQPTVRTLSGSQQCFQKGKKHRKSPWLHWHKKVSKLCVLSSSKYSYVDLPTRAFTLPFILNWSIGFDLLFHAKVWVNIQQCTWVSRTKNDSYLFFWFLLFHRIHAAFLWRSLAPSYILWQLRRVWLD